MTIEVDKQDLVNLVKGVVPNYELMRHFLIKPNGDYVGGFVDKWQWNVSNLKDQSEEVLYDIYKRCKESWNK